MLFGHSRVDGFGGPLCSLNFVFEVGFACHFKGLRPGLSVASVLLVFVDQGSSKEPFKIQICST